MKFRLKRDMPKLGAGAIFVWDGVSRYTTELTVGDPYTYTEMEVISLPDWFEPLPEGEQPEQLTEDDFVQDIHGTIKLGDAVSEIVDGSYKLAASGRDKLIRMSKRLGKGEV